MNYTTGKIKLKAAARVYNTAAANYRLSVASIIHP